MADSEPLSIFVTVGPKPPADQAYCRPGYVLGPIGIETNDRLEWAALAYYLGARIITLAHTIETQYASGELGEDLQLFLREQVATFTRLRDEARAAGDTGSERRASVALEHYREIMAATSMSPD